MIETGQATVCWAKGAGITRYPPVDDRFADFPAIHFRIPKVQHAFTLATRIALHYIICRQTGHSQKWYQ